MFVTIFAHKNHHHQPECICRDLKSHMPKFLSHFWDTGSAVGILGHQSSERSLLPALDVINTPSLPFPGTNGFKQLLSALSYNSVKSYFNIIQCLEDGEGGIKGAEGGEKPRVTSPSTDTRDKTNKLALYMQRLHNLRSELGYFIFFNCNLPKIKKINS